MGRIGKTIDDLNRFRQQWLDALPGAGGGEAEEPQPDTGAHARALIEITDFAPNPGHLRMLAYVPEGIVGRPALVVVLHGCRQTAEGYDLGTGWSQLAEQEKFILCLPEQRGGNNPHHCFNWFTERNTARGTGEAGSIHAMVEHLAAAHDVDPARIFVTGLSAGGAMAATMLATYPETFAAGAVIAGLPYRAAVSVGGAMNVMAHGDQRSGLDAADSVRSASDHAGPWPRLSVWHGMADETVTQLNAGALVRQWRDLHGLRAAPSREEQVSGHAHRTWDDPSGAVVIEEFEIGAFGHGAPLNSAELGQPGPFILEAGISSTRLIADFFGLTPRRESVIGRVRKVVGL